MGGGGGGSESGVLLNLIKQTKFILQGANLVGDSLTINHWVALFFHVFGLLLVTPSINGLMSQLGF